ncbi:tetratricopeptide repeat-containing sensor histidine kinase [Fibrella aquatilis]|uniref:histidine kinase n=1 Tax=Fibrella aquatilis TaxID=2817059 RepID=A0A939JZV7_9BACT|nr:histidine kinase dimerization/phosphoacceptor domain -containing protein [Fibrella aquatilis]MBO0931823.1 tetratricopeptide repeat protein [Fibrella aquatilis]
MKPDATFYHQQLSRGLPGVALSDRAVLLFRNLLRSYILVTGLLLTGLPGQGQNINRQMVNHYLQQLANSPTDTTRINALIELGKFHVLKYGEVKPDLDSAKGYLHQAKALSIKLNLPAKRHAAETMLVVAHMELRDTIVGKLLFNELINDCKRTNDRNGQADALSRFGACSVFTTKNFPEVVACYAQAASIYKALGNYESEIMILREIAAFHTNQGKLDLGNNEFVNVLNRYKAIGYPKLHYTYSWLSYINRLKGNYGKALGYSFLCLESMNRTRDTLLAATFYGDVAQVYWELGKQEQAISWYKKALMKWQHEKQAELTMYNVASIIARDMTARHKALEAINLLKTIVREIPPINKVQKGCIAQSLANCYKSLHQSVLAERYYLEAIDWYEKSHQNTEMSQKVQAEVGQFYLEQQDVKKAGLFLEKALALFPQKHALSTVKDIHYMLFKVDSAQGKYLSAIRHFRIHKALNDSLFSETKAKQIAQLEIQYETKENQQNIALLRKQSNLQAAELGQARTTRNTILICSVLLLCLLALSYNRYRLKQRSNQLLEIKQLEINRKNQTLETLLTEQQQLLTEKEWMLKEIHHRVKNNLQIITSLLHSQGVFLKDEAAQSAIRESQNRVHAMALIHQKLYQSDQLTAIPMAGYVTEIVDYLIQSFDREDTVRKQISLVLIELDVTLAVPLGLIINEVVTNSLKHAFPFNRAGVIWVDLVTLDSQTYQLTVSDNGIGLPDDINPNRSRTLGMSLIRGLSKQLGGNLQIDNNDGVQISLLFPAEKIDHEPVINS